MIAFDMVQDLLFVFYFSLLCDYLVKGDALSIFCEISEKVLSAALVVVSVNFVFVNEGKLFGLSVHGLLHLRFQLEETLLASHA